MTAAAHYTAFKTQLSGGILDGRVHDAVRFNNGQPVRDNYVVAYPSTAHRLDDARYMAPQRSVSSALYRYDVRSVATSAAGVLLFAQTVRDRLIGQSVTVAGRRCDLIRLVDAVEESAVEFDKVADLFYLDDSFEFWSHPL